MSFKLNSEQINKLKVLTADANNEKKKLENCRNTTLFYLLCSQCNTCGQDGDINIKQCSSQQAQADRTLAFLQDCSLTKLVKTDNIYHIFAIPACGLKLPFHIFRL